jgi:hypothetical protein
MLRTLSALLLAMAALAGGCVPSDLLQPDAPTSGAAMVQNSPFATPTSVTARPNLGTKPAPAAAEVGIVVDRIGRQILVANPAVAVKPVFLTIGAQQPEIFHQDTSVIYITEGLVRLCKTEGQLAAVLSVELGRMASERESIAHPDNRYGERRPPIAVTMGNAGQFSGLEQLQQVEVANLDLDRPRSNKRFVPPDPNVLARGYLKAAGLDEQELDAAAPILAQADKNYIIEKQFKGPSDTPTWTPR